MNVLYDNINIKGKPGKVKSAPAMSTDASQVGVALFPSFYMIIGLCDIIQYGKSFFFFLKWSYSRKIAGKHNLD